jgi:murein DD-endopeptidase MepM/ murein hydrolase activator NlpD
MSRRTYGRTAAVLAAMTALGGATGATALGAGSGGVAPGGTAGTSTTAASSSGTFPIRGHHTYGDGLGAGRGHQGQDLLAKCGKPVVAALSGRVSYVSYHSAAGNYVVIHGSAGNPDTVYMHLSERASVRRGEKLATGDSLGRVGRTGDASACHLHFEMWSSPGWEKGGSLIDPVPYLKRWDRR